MSQQSKTSIFYAIRLCGLSQHEAADTLKVSLNVVKSWCIGRTEPPAHAWITLAALFQELEAASHRIIINAEGPVCEGSKIAPAPSNAAKLSAALFYLRHHQLTSSNLDTTPPAERTQTEKPHG